MRETLFERVLRWFGGSRALRTEPPPAPVYQSTYDPSTQAAAASAAARRAQTLQAEREARRTARAAPAGINSIANPEPSNQPWPEVILRGRAGLEQCIAAGDWDTARAALQKLAYSMTDAPPEQKAAFTQIASSYAARDPLCQQVMAVLLPVVTREPGIKQTASYSLFPSVDPEWIRYALYYADVLGKLQRRKKGNSYTLWPAGTPPPTATPAKGKSSKPGLPGLADVDPKKKR